MRLLKLSETGVETSVSVLYDALQKPGAVVLLPTETVYGLVARADDEQAYRRIYALKQRPFEKRLGWFIGNWRKLPEFGVNMSGLPERLAAQFFPGALTIIASRYDGGTQGVRVPDHPLLKKLLEKIGQPLLQTSANASGHPDPLSCDEAISQLAGQVDCAVDGGRLSSDACGSTVVDATGTEIRILRQGAIDLHNWS